PGGPVKLEINAGQGRVYTAVARGDGTFAVVSGDGVLSGRIDGRELVMTDARGVATRVDLEAAQIRRTGNGMELQIEPGPNGPEVTSVTTVSDEDGIRFQLRPGTQLPAGYSVTKDGVLTVEPGVRVTYDITDGTVTVHGEHPITFRVGAPTQDAAA